MVKTVEGLYDLYRRANRQPGCFFKSNGREQQKCKRQLRVALERALNNLVKIRMLRRLGLSTPIPLGQLARVLAMAQRENVQVRHDDWLFQSDLRAVSHQDDIAERIPAGIGMRITDGEWVSEEFAEAVAFFVRYLPRWGGEPLSLAVLRSNTALTVEQATQVGQYIEQHGEALGLRVPQWATVAARMRDRYAFAAVPAAPEAAPAEAAPAEAAPAEAAPAIEECGICCDAPATARSCTFFLDHKNRHPVCNHRFCVDCLAEYISTAYANHKTHVGCPEPGCPCQILVGDARRIGGAALADRAPKRLVRDAAAVDGEAVKQCPGCTLPIFRDEGCTEMTCTCGTVFHWHTLEVFRNAERAAIVAAAAAAAADAAEAAAAAEAAEAILWPTMTLPIPTDSFWNEGDSAIARRANLQEQICSGRWVRHQFVTDLCSYVLSECRRSAPYSRRHNHLPLVRGLTRRTAKPIDAKIDVYTSIPTLTDMALTWLDRGTRVNHIYRTRATPFPQFPIF